MSDSQTVLRAIDKARGLIHSANAAPSATHWTGPVLPEAQLAQIDQTLADAAALITALGAPAGRAEEEEPFRWAEPSEPEESPETGG